MNANIFTNKVIMWAMKDRKVCKFQQGSRQGVVDRIFQHSRQIYYEQIQRQELEKVGEQKTEEAMCQEALGERGKDLTSTEMAQ